MLPTITSPASLAARTAIGTRTGLSALASVDPVLCCPVASVAAKAAGYAVGYLSANGSTDESTSEGENAPNFSGAVCAYIAPGRLTTSVEVVADDASVEELIRTLRG